MFAALLSASLLSPAAPVPKEAKKPPDRARILGAWDVYGDEKAVGTGTVIVWTFTDGKMHSSSGNSDWEVQLDPDQSPKQFALSNARGGEIYRGIYEFDGDRLRIAYSGGQERPVGFDARPGVTLHVLVKSKEQPGK